MKGAYSSASPQVTLSSVEKMVQHTVSESIEKITLSHLSKPDGELICGLPTPKSSESLASWPP